MYNLTENSDNYSKTPVSLWQCHKNEPALNNDGGIIDFPNKNNSPSFMSKKKKKTGHRSGSRNFKIGEHSMQPAKKILGFRWSKKAEITSAKYFYQHFQTFLIFIDKVLSIFQNLLRL